MPFLGSDRTPLDKELTRLIEGITAIESTPIDKRRRNAKSGNTSIGQVE